MVVIGVCAAYASAIAMFLVWGTAVMCQRGLVWAGVSISLAASYLLRIGSMAWQKHGCCVADSVVYSASMDSSIVLRSRTSRSVRLMV